MARAAQISAEEARRQLVDAAEQYCRVRRGAAVVIVRGEVDVIPRAGGRPAEPEPGELSGYKAAIMRALTDTPVGYRRLARVANLRPNSYFRSQLSLLVEAGRVRRTRRGYSRPSP